MGGVDPLMVSTTMAAVRERRPRVHCLTNHVARAFTANVLLAIGAVPSMSADAEEIAEFVAGSDALLVNLGTLDAAMKTAIGIAVDTAAGRNLPVVLDPVFADRSELRSGFARQLLRRSPTAIRCNGLEAQALGEAALEDAVRAGTIVALTGPIDRVTASDRTMEIEGGHPLMASVTAIGCALGAATAACLSTEAERFDAVAAACGLFKLAGSRAGAGSSGPGTFVPAFLDALHAVSQGREAEDDG